MATKSKKPPQNLPEEALLLIERSFGFLPPGDESQMRAALAGVDVQRREMAIAPKTADAEKRTIQTVVATEAPARMWDSSRWEPVDEILLMSGCRLADVRGGKLPLLDCHMRDTARNVLGSVVDLKIEADKLTGLEVFSSLANAEFQKSAEGHLDQRSVGYRVLAALYVEPGESTVIGGKTFTATAARALRIATDWLPMEESVVPIGADPNSGIRSLPTQQPPQKEDTNMDPKLREILVSKGMSPSATDEEARVYFASLEKPAPAKVEPVNDEAKRELERRDGIAGAFKPYIDRDGVRALHDKAVAEKMTLDESRSALLKHLADASQSLGVRVTQSEDDQFRANLLAALQVRAESTIKDAKGLGLDAEAKSRAAQFRGLSLLDMCKESLTRRGLNVRGMDRLELVGRAFTHSSGDFTYLLESTARKVLLAAYATAPATWSQFCTRGELADYKTASRTKMSEAGVMTEVPAGAEIPEHSMTEGKETITLKSYGEIFSITRQAIINDDLGAFTRLPAAHARAWARTVNRLVYQKLLANAAMLDGIELFKGGHSNLDGSTAAVTSVDTAAAVLRSLRSLILKQKDLDGTSPLNLPLSIVLAPPTIEPYFAQAIFEGGRGSNNSAVDIVRLGLQLVADAEMENSSLTGYSAAAVYGFASPMDAAVIEVSFLDGNEAPRLEVEQGFSIDGTKFKVAGDVGVAVIDHRGAAKFLNGAS
jgi:hypothetical protein